MKNSLSLFLLLPLLLFCSTPDKVEETKSINEISISDGWARPSKIGMMSAAYFTITNGTNEPDSLLSVDSSISNDTQIHESYTTEDGLMGMQPQGLVPIPANSEVTFKQGGLHIMIIQPKRDLVEGDSISLNLYFSSSKELEITLPIKSSN